jgi:CRISPR-associated protein Cst2
MSNIYSLTICGRVTLNLHSLNNEGGEGNQISTRMVNIVGQDGGLHAVNAISGDMFKHIQAEHYHRVALSRGLALCSGCRKFDPNRILADEEFIQSFTKSTSDARIVDMLLQRCALDDAEGVLITANNKSTPRKSAVEFGWVVGVPHVTTTDSYFHVKYVTDSGTKGERTERDSSNLGQNIFHRPANSGIYAIVVHVEAARIGFNDIAQTYAISDEERTNRHRALLESLLYTFVELNGAMRNTQHPHLVNFDGVVATSRAAIPAPTMSPLHDNYREELEQITQALNSLQPEAIELQPFEGLGAFSKVMADLVQTTPFALRY